MDCFEKLTGAIRQLPDPGRADFETKVQNCLKALLNLSKEMKLMKRLKQIRRELHVILKVVTEQKNVMEQMAEALESEEYGAFKSGAKLAKRRICKRQRQVVALDTRAEDIFKDVSYFLSRNSEQ